MPEASSGPLTDPPQNSDRWRVWHWTLVLGIALIRFVNLGFRDLQAWDEALYAVRAEAIVRFGAWLDQSAYAIDGLYSSLHPPLHVWLTAIVFHLFGDGELQARLISAVAGALTLPVILFLGRRVYDRPTAVLAVCLYGLNPFVLFYSRQGQLDTLLVLLLTCSVLFVIRMIENGSRRDALVAGLALGAALLTKLFVAALLPVALAGGYLMVRDPRIDRLRGPVLVFVASAAIVALPWHVMMTIRHGGGDPLFFFLQSSLWQRMTTGVEGNVKPLEILYYINQFIVLFPLGALWLIEAFRRGMVVESPGTRMLSAWFLVFFIVFTLMRTKLAVYMLPMLVPGSLLAARALWVSMADVYERRRWSILLPGTVLAMVWSTDQAWRTATKEVLGSLAALSPPPDDVLASFLRLLLVAAILAGTTFLAARLPALGQFRIHAIFSLLLVLTFSALYQITVEDRTTYRDGACELRILSDEYRIQHMVVAGSGSNPQLSYYFDGGDLGWRDDLHIRRITPPPDTLQYRAWLNDEMTGEDLSVLLVIEKDRFIRYTTVRPSAFVPDQFQPVFESRRYAGYVRASRELAMGERPPPNWCFE